MVRSTTANRAAAALGLGALAIVLAVGCDAGADAGASLAFEDWYPEDVSAPPGTRYPCALTALPRDLPGIPAGDRAFVNHAYSLVLEATHAKLELMRDVESDSAAALAAYEARIGDVVERFGSETPPEGLGRFRADVVEAIRLQREAFAVAVRDSAGGAGRAVFGRPEARKASRRLIRAWGAMKARYPEASAELADSAYHHLCALDLF
jgi:hypothetical protein